MRALTITPGEKNSLQLVDRSEPTPGPNDLLVDGLAIGVCGTDKEILSGAYGWAPPGEDRLVLGHESLGRVKSAPSDSNFTEGDLVVGVVRRPDPVPCGACAHGEFDMCRNGRYRERGIKQLDGYGSERWCVEADYAVKVDPRLASVGMLMEPTTLVAKAWEPVGLLAAVLGVQRGLDVHVLDRVTDGPKPDLVRSFGATYHHESIDEVAGRPQPDVVMEATGVARLVFDSIANTGSYGIVCLTGVSPKGRNLDVDAGALNREIVLENDAVIGSVNANLRHYQQAADALAKADLELLARMISRRVPLDRFSDAFTAQDDDIKVVITLDGSN